MDQTDQSIPKCKVVLLGESGVGKTCIISRYINGSFDDKSESTNGASYASRVNDYPNLGKSLRLDIWDTAGQERYRSLTKFFYKDAAIAILVYDITRKNNCNENLSKIFILFFFLLLELLEINVINIMKNKLKKKKQELLLMKLKLYLD